MAAAQERQHRSGSTGAAAALVATVAATVVAVRGPEAVLGQKAAKDEKGVWITQYHKVWIKVWIGGYGSCVGPGP